MGLASLDICVLKVNLESNMIPKSLNSFTHLISILFYVNDSGIFNHLLVTTMKNVLVQLTSNLFL